MTKTILDANVLSEIDNIEAGHKSTVLLSYRDAGNEKTFSLTRKYNSNVYYSYRSIQDPVTFAYLMKSMLGRFKQSNVALIVDCSDFKNLSSIEIARLKEIIRISTFLLVVKSDQQHGDEIISPLDFPTYKDGIFAQCANDIRKEIKVDQPLKILMTHSSRNDRQIADLIQENFYVFQNNPSFTVKFTDALAYNVQIASEISSEFQKYFANVEENSNDIQYIYKQMESGHKILNNLIERTNNQLFGHEFKCAGRQFHYLNHLAKYLEFMDYLNESIRWSNNAELWQQALRTTMDGITESREVYEFLMELLDKLSTYKVQMLKANYKDKIPDIGSFIQFTKDIGFYSGLTESRVQAIKSSQFRIDHLNRVLNYAIKFDVTTTYKDVGGGDMKTLTVQGAFIKFSDIPKEIPSQVKFVEIFALNKVFIDASFNQIDKGIQMSIIAPVWEVQTDASIQLDGMNCDSYFMKDEDKSKKAANGKWSGADGKNGKDGGSGGNAGTFFGISESITNSDSLKISASGGNGFAGQNGGDGTNGTDGPEMNFHSHISQLDAEFSSALYPNNGADTILLGLPGIKAGNGGNGGSGGAGGNAGIVYIVSGSPHQVDILNKTGINGQNGKGGKAGKPGRIWKFTDIEKDGHPNESQVDFDVVQDGSEGVNNVKPYKGPRGLIDPIEVIINYKIFAISHLDKNVNQGKIIEFLNNFERNGMVQSLHKDAEGYLIEMRNVESLYRNVHKLGSSIDNLKNSDSDCHQNLDRWIYKPLLGKIEDKLKTSGNDDKTIYANLKILINKRQKLSGAPAGEWNDLVQKFDSELVSLEKYTKLQYNNANEIRYRQNTASKIMKSKAIIRNDIEPCLKIIFEEMASHLTELIAEVDKLRKDLIKEREKLDEQSRQVALSMQISGLLTPLRFLTKAASFSSHPVATIAGGVVDITLDTVTSAYDGSVTEDELKSKLSLPEAFKKFVDNEKIEPRVKRIISQIDSAIGILKKDPIYSKLSDELEKKMSDLKDGASRAARAESTIKQLQTLFSTKVTEAEGKVSSLTDDSTETYRAYITELYIYKRVSGVFSLTSVPANLYTKMKKDNQMLQMIAEAKYKNSKNMIKVNAYTESVGNNIDRAIGSIQDKINKMSQNLDVKTHTELILANLKFLEMISEIAGEIEKTEGFAASSKLKSSFKSLQEHMASIFAIYKQIQTDFKDFENTNIILAKDQHDHFGVTNEKYISYMKAIYSQYSANDILITYDGLLEKLQQHTYPFNVEEIYSLEPLNEANQTLKSIAEQATKRYETLHSSLSKYEFATNSATFYTWGIQDRIDHLLEGKTVQLKADLPRSPNGYAIKFSNIRLHFNVQNDQAKLDSALKDVLVTMDYAGPCRYQYNRKIVDKDCKDQTIKYRYGSENGYPAKGLNTFYTETSGKYLDFLPSPYANWNIKLNIQNATYMKALTANYHDQISLNLIGNAEYVQTYGQNRTIGGNGSTILFMDYLNRIKRGSRPSTTRRNVAIRDSDYAHSLAYSAYEPKE